MSSEYLGMEYPVWVQFEVIGGHQRFWSASGISRPKEDFGSVG